MKGLHALYIWRSTVGSHTWDNINMHKRWVDEYCFIFTIEAFILSVLWYSAAYNDAWLTQKLSSWSLWGWMPWYWILRNCLCMWFFYLYVRGYWNNNHDALPVMSTSIVYMCIAVTVLISTHTYYDNLHKEHTSLHDNNNIIIRLSIIIMCNKSLDWQLQHEWYYIYILYYSQWPLVMHIRLSLTI